MRTRVLHIKRFSIILFPGGNGRTVFVVNDILDYFYFCIRNVLIVKWGKWS